MQLIIRENNEHEGESWIYVLDVTEEERRLIIAALAFEIDESLIEVLEGPISDEEIEIIRKWINTGYLPVIGKYKLNPKSFAKAIEDGETMYEDVFYKANGLIKL